MNKAQHQLETLLSGEVSQLYQALTGHQPVLTDCRFLSENELAFVFESSMTSIEQLFYREGRFALARNIRANVDQIFHQKLNHIVENKINRSVIDILSDSKIETGRKSIILVLEPLACCDEAANKQPITP